MSAASTALAFERGLPASVDAERLVLGAVQMNEAHWDVCSVLEPDDFSTEPHRLIYAAMRAIHQRGESIDRVMLYSELARMNAAVQVGGLTYLVSLDDGIPHVANVEGYVRIVQEKSRLRKAIFAAQSLMNRCFLDEQPCDEILDSAQKTLREIADGQGKHGEWLSPCEVIEQWDGGVHGYLHRPQGGAGISTPWEPLTEALAGLHRGDLFIVAGRPSMGKSCVAMQMAYHVAKQGYGAAFFSLEMSKESLVDRLVAGIARVDAQKIRTGYTNDEERARMAYAIDQIDKSSLWIDDTRACTTSAIAGALRKLSAKHEISLVVIDHLQLMTAQGRRGQNRHQELTEVLHELKHEAVRLNATVMLLSQLNRSCEVDNRRPQKSDLKETGTAEEDADVVLLIHRPECYVVNHGREDLRGVAEFLIAKQRNGPTGKKNMVFLGEYQVFESRATAFQGEDYE